MGEEKNNKGTKVLERVEISEEFKWSIENMYQDESHWENDYNRVKELIEEFSQYQGKLNNSKGLLNALNLYEMLYEKALKVYTYAKMKRDEDNTNTKYQGLTDKAQGLYIKTESAVAFFVPEILQISEEEINQYYSEKDELKKYQHYLSEILRNKEHVLSIEEEQIIAQAGEIAHASQDIFTMLNNADMKFPTILDENGEEVEVTHGNFIQLLESSDGRVRKDVFSALYNTYNSFKNTLATTFSSNLKKDYFFAKVKKHKSSIDAALFDNNIPIDVYDKLIDTIHENLHLMHRYVNLRKKMLGVDELHMYDLYTPMIKDIEMSVSYEKAKELIMKGLEPLGKEYINILKSGFKNRWVDVYENAGKTSGAYSWGTYDSYPFILMSYKDNVDSMFTLAHEMGHSIHSYYTAQNQPFIYSDYKIFVAEVASTVNEALVMDYMLKNTKDLNEKMYLLNYYLEQFRTTVYRQTMFAEFEKITHDKIQIGEALTVDDLNKIYHDLNVKYYGPDIVVDSHIDIEWARIPHFYNSFYVYQYATGYSAAIAFSKQILEEGEIAANRYIDFLKSGSSDYSINVLKKAGVDMTSSEPIKSALKVFESLLDDMENIALSKKINLN
ncbi:oligoendopeptidase F [Alkaliphilus sp. MSJ-5]|uniref:Oligopeptidase F n=1 Tax=Alkaliphilus flagellatus TaxID=2841507 RepID=A0ABS6G2F4_9FIRM|nr:oligoendopeptidase F [Alkaliphilus flagellatus]MBU5675585.1 oligoendopeptidase F [Alkaliphilus flagellatus]